ncbi:transcriptional regulator, partial [Oenococcus oeni]
DLAGKLFISRQAISKWESGETTPDLNNLIKLSELLDVSLDTLVLGSE